MARNEQDREDLLREATALVERVELRCDGFVDPVVIGFRRQGECSIFVGADPVIQFNSKLELRRGFIRGRLLKAVAGKLVVLERHRTEDEVQLLRTDLTDGETLEILDQFHSRLIQLRQVLKQQRFTVIGQVPTEAPIVERVLAWLESLPESLRLADAPNAR